MKKNYHDLLDLFYNRIWFKKISLELVRFDRKTHLPIPKGRFLLMILFLIINCIDGSAQTFSSTWNLTSDGSASTSGTITAASASIGSGINTPAYSSADGITTAGWANDAANLNQNEYYQYQVTPTTGNKITIGSVTLNHSVTNGNWICAVYYSFDGFATAGTQIGSNFNSNSTSPTAQSFTGLSYVVPTGGSFTIRVYAWESDGGGRRFRNRNVVISGSSCALTSITTQPSSATACEGNSVTLSVIATNATSYQWKRNNVAIGGQTSSSLTFSTVSLSDAASYTVDAISSCNTVTSTAAVLTVNAKPTAVTIVPSSASVCANDITLLTANGGVVSGVTILSENFNGATNNWTTENTSTNGTPANAAWKLRPNGYNYNSGTIFNSNDNSQFYLSNSDEQGTGSTTSTRLISPSFDLTGSTSASLSFYHYFRNSTGDSAKVQISTDGGVTWSGTDLASYTTTQGAVNAFALVTINLTPYVSFSNVKIRFNYSATWDWYWAIDNVTITASKPQIIWTPQTGLYTDASASTAYTGQITSTVYAKLVTSGSFTATATNAAGCSSSGSMSITVNPNITPTFTAVPAICSGGSLSALPTTSNNGIVGTWSPALNNLATTTYTFTPNTGQCATTTTLTITVNPNITPTFTAVPAICSGGSLSTLPTTSNNGIVGTWSPTLNNLATTTYTFTPNVGQCGTTTTLTITVNPNTTYYQDLDGDGFGNPAAIQLSCTGAPVGYVTNNSDCNDNQLQYVDADGDGFGSTTQVACGVANNSDCNDNQLQYTDADGDGFGSTNLVACGVTNNSDCNDNQLQYADADGDGFGSTTQVACGVANNSDCNDNQLQHADADGDGFGSTTLVACGVTNNSDCNDNQLQYADADGDGFGSTTQVACGVTNNSDCNDNQLQYADADGDGFGSTTQVACGVANNSDCNDNQLQYADADSDGFGSTTQVACGVANNSDCNDNQLQYADADGDGFGSITLVACGVTNNSDCNDNQLQYADADGDGYGSTTQVACGVSNNLDCNDTQIQYIDHDGDGFGSATQTACGVTNNSDCNDGQIQYLDTDGDGFGTSVQVACGAAFSGDCNDSNNTIHPGAVEVCYDGIDNNCNGIIDEGCTPIVSVVQSSQCGTVLPSISSNIYANLVPGAQGYRFKITDLSTNQVQVIDKALRVFAITQLGNYAFNRSYQIEVAVRYNHVWQPFYGLPCTVTTPATTTTVQIAQCGSTLTAINDVVFADNVPYATGYKFRITNLLTSAQEEIIRPIRDIRMTNFSNPEYNTTYSVEVAIRNTNGLYLPYGAACTVTTPSFPTSQLQISQCDVTLTSNNVMIYADSFPGATTYRFRFTNGSFVYSFDRPIRSFNLNSVPGLLPSTTYSVQVAIEINGVFGPFGKVCTLTTAGAAKLEDASNVEITQWDAFTYPNPFVNGFMLNVKSASNEIIRIKVYDMLGKIIEDKNSKADDLNSLELGSNYPSGIYNVMVSQGNEIKTLRIIKR